MKGRVCVPSLQTRLPAQRQAALTSELAAFATQKTMPASSSDGLKEGHTYSPFHQLTLLSRGLSVIFHRLRTNINNMEITWQGDTTVTVKGNKAKVVINAKDAQATADNVLIFTEEQGKEGMDVFDWPGEYETRGVAITCLQAWTKPKDEEKAEPTLIAKFEIDGVKFCHLGNLGHDLSAEMIDKIGNVDVLIVPVDGNLGMKKLHDILEEMEPRAVMPIQYSNLDTFFKEMGTTKPEVAKSYTVKNISQFSEDKREYIVLSEA